MRVVYKLICGVLMFFGAGLIGGCSIQSDPRSLPVNPHLLLQTKTQIRLKNGEIWCINSFKGCKCDITVIASDGQKTELSGKYCRYRDIKHPTHFAFGMDCRDMANPDPNLISACILSTEEDFSSYDCQNPGVSRADQRTKFVFGSRQEFRREISSTITTDEDFDLNLTPTENERSVPVGAEFKYLKASEECGASESAGG